MYDLNIHDVSQIANYSGGSHKVTELAYIILGLDLRLPWLSKPLIWFNGSINHFIFQFSNDGSTETSELGISIG